MIDKKMVAFYGVAAVVILMVIVLIFGGVGKNDDHTWQVKQSVGGQITMIDSPGYYPKWFATVWTYPRSVQKYWSQDPTEGSPEDESIKVTFNDGGIGMMSTMIRYQTPVEVDLRRKAHRDFSGSIDNMTDSVRAHLVNCLKATAPLMSASEHQSARKAEFTQLVYEQLQKGLYSMKKIEKRIERKDAEGKPVGEPIILFATEIILDDKGNPVIAQPSPLDQYGIQVLQFSVTGTEYDPETLKQFAAKKEFFLEAERSKAEKEAEVAERLMVTERGLRERAEIEAIANKEMAKQTIEAQMQKEVAEIEAQKKVEVAKQAKEEAETQAQMKVEVAKLHLEEQRLITQAADEEAKAIKTLAAAEEEKINVAGAVTEKERVLAEIAAERDVKVAENLSKIQTPSVVFFGGGEADGSMDNLTSKLINLRLMNDLGVLDRPIKAPAQTPN